MSGTQQQPKSLEQRLFRNKRFELLWLAFLAAVFLFVSWPIRNCLLVCWVYGSSAFFHQGIRVVSAKPTIFSDGTPAPTLPNLVTGFGAFVVTTVGLTLLLVAALRLYERYLKRPKV